jgi:hypothetical protein
MAKMSHREGAWFAVPPRGGSFDVGVIARPNPKSALPGVLLRSKTSMFPSSVMSPNSNPATQALGGQVGHLGLTQCTSSIAGHLLDWDRAGWSMR